MIRFIPDTWLDGLLRPIAMAAPDGAVYVEFMAPDWRFVFILGLALAWIFVGWRRQWRLSATAVLLVFVSLSFVSWLLSSGNGRYFMPILLAAGPLCVALIYHLPLAKKRRIVIAACAIGLQSFAVYEADPFWHQSFGAWGNDPFFEISPHPQMLEENTTYITFTGLSYSLIAPKFHQTSRWINVSSQIDSGGNTVESRRIQGILAASKNLKLIIPTLSGLITKQNVPTDELTREVTNILAPHRLKLGDPRSCQFIASKGLARRQLGKIDGVNPTLAASFGFVVCSLDYPIADVPKSNSVVDFKAERIFDRLESDCPRIFAHGPRSATTKGGYMRFYPSPDIRVYVFNDGPVYYKSWRMMNPMLIGMGDDILGETFKMDCSNIQGRSGMPWNRGL